MYWEFYLLELHILTDQTTIFEELNSLKLIVRVIGCYGVRWVFITSAASVCMRLEPGSLPT